MKIVRQSGFISTNLETFFALPGRGTLDTLNNLNCFIHVFQILADRGFTLQEDFVLLGVSLITPAHTKGRKQLSGREVEESRVKSNIRIHIGNIYHKNTISFAFIQVFYDSAKSTSYSLYTEHI